MEPQDLKEWRIQMEISQEEMAYLLGMSRSGYQKREQGSVPLTWETKYAIRYLAENPSEIAFRLTCFESKRQGVGKKKDPAWKPQSNVTWLKPEEMKTGWRYKNEK